MCFPRIRGDVPHLASLLVYRLVFSPHTRGCSHDLHTGGFLKLVFPAYAGMFRNTGLSATGSAGFPRIRGDVPQPSRIKRVSIKFSPHTRGCS